MAATAAAAGRGHQPVAFSGWLASALESYGSARPSAKKLAAGSSGPKSAAKLAVVMQKAEAVKSVWRGSCERKEKPARSRSKLCGGGIEAALGVSMCVTSETSRCDAGESENEMLINSKSHRKQLAMRKPAGSGNGYQCEI